MAADAKAVGDVLDNKLDRENPVFEGTLASNLSHATGDCTVALGENTTASGHASFAEGFYTVASGNYQHAQGQYNIEDSDNKYAHIVGNGDLSKRSNAHTLDWDGNAWFAGDIYVGSTSGANKDEGSKKLLVEDDILISIQDIDVICGTNIQAVTSEIGTF